MTEVTVSGLFVHPVKSCRGIALSSAMLTERGLAYDREWMVVGGDGRFLSQRELPRLSLVETRMTSGSLSLSAPGVGSIGVPLANGGTKVTVTVWRDTVQAIDQGAEPASWLSTYLGREARLVRFDRSEKRYCNPEYAGDSGAHTGFADAYPLLVLSEASLDDLNRRLELALPIDRFRPNVVLRGVEAYDEDHMAAIAVGDALLRPVKPCTRCQITTTDQATATVGIEPLPTLARYRMNAALGGVAFGVNAIVEAGAGSTIGVGAPARCILDFWSARCILLPRTAEISFNAPGYPRSQRLRRCLCVPTRWARTSPAVRAAWGRSLPGCCCPAGSECRAHRPPPCSGGAADCSC